ncbi:trypsin-like serine protease [Phytohabitans sp. ZYX-F-186]|uniref:Trypsin-like serine protease n=1 Tax=Phytohabitans maris TaxID=3071409 RepID=A0ABU0ZC82_9ACTN|nr:trypsin-like serine protease [Phytohabitans sp. ZYX-F-186]MDQ7904668.1 trypsin-like serine protease [Phytohabitans sp. ZYX-F-186]
MASLIKAKPDGDRHACGANLVSPTYVVTVAHCVTNPDGSLEDHTRMRVRIGSASWRSGGQVSAVAGVEVFPGWDGDALRPPQPHADLALLRLATAVADVTPFPLASHAGMAVSTRVVGWGVQVDDRCAVLPDGAEPPAQVLHELDGVTAPAQRCAAVWITDGELCVQFDRQATCGGDSGSPVLQKIDGRWQLVGVMSHAYGLVPRCERAVPAVAATDLTNPHYRAWIIRIACAPTPADPDPCRPPAGRQSSPDGGFE